MTKVIAWYVTSIIWDTWYPVMLASYHGHAPLVRLLLSYGGDPNTVNDRGQSPLAGAVFKNEMEVIDVLLQGGADPDWGHPSAMEAIVVFRKEELRNKFDSAPGKGKMATLANGFN